MKKILIVEDESQLVSVYQKVLTQEGFEVTSVATVVEGVEQVEKFNPNLIILDIMLPGGQNGFDFLENIKKDPRYKNIPVLVMTNLDSEENTARAIGANDYLVKANTPITEVVAKIKEFLPN